MKKTTNEFNDLCTTCNNPPKCDSTRAGRRPVYFCEQFDIYVPPKSTPKLKQAKAKSQDEPAGKYFGICGNCDYRETCANSTNEGGVWHCEEYQ
ncbi:hypothetical protein KKB99_00505 [bacterium]|nr:hypothetical protein [bacterium]MBU1024466.1 hypothetical protein [bacterium]